MNGYFIRKILKNTLICLFACWLIYSIKVGDRYFGFDGVADCENFVFCSGCDACNNWEKW